jgi:hypothetical protein
VFTHREGIRKNFTVDGFAYVVEYRNHAVHFYIDFAKSPNSRELLPEDFGRFDFFESFPERVYEVEVPVKDVFRVKREVIGFLDNLLRKVKPHFFDFTALTARRVSVYRRIAQRLATRYGYWVEEDGRAFRFYRMTWAVDPKPSLEGVNPEAQAADAI